MPRRRPQLVSCERREAEIIQLATRAGVEPLRTEMKAEFAPIRSEWRSWGGM